MSSRKRLSPRFDIRTLDNQPFSYPTILRTGDVRLGNEKLKFDDTKTSIFGAESLISYPGLQLSSSLTNKDIPSSIVADGLITKNIDDVNYARLRDANISPYKEVCQAEQDIKATDFFAIGSDPTKFGNDFAQSLGAKTKIVIELPIKSSTKLQVASASIYYLNAVNGKFEEINTGNRHKVSPNINMWEMRLFNALGANIASSTLNDTLNLGWFGYPDNTHELSTLANSFLGSGETGNNNLTKMLLNIATGSALQNSQFAATGSQLIALKDYIQHPFLLEKFYIELPMAAGPGWLNDFTKFRRISSVNSFCRTDPFDHGGPALTIALSNQLATNNRDLILSATIIPHTDNFSSADPDVEVSDTSTNIYQERFARGFLSYASPGAVVSPNIGTYFTGAVKLYGTPTIANGVTSLNFGTPPGSWGASGNDGLNFRNSFSLTINPFGRNMSTNQSGRSYFGKEFAIPTEDPIAKLSEFGVGPGGSNNVYIFNYEQNETSPYLLFPTDKLVLSLSKYRSCISKNTTGTPYTFGTTPLPLDAYHDVALSTGSIKLVLYGSLIRAGKEYHDTNNQDLDTAAVHQAIHELVIDEYDVAYRSELSGSYDTGKSKLEYIDGNSDSYTFVSNPLTRLSYNHELDITNISHSSSYSSATYRSQRLTNHYERNGFCRGMQVYSDGEYFYDSYHPRLDEYINKFTKNYDSFATVPVFGEGNDWEKRANYYVNSDTKIRYVFEQYDPVPSGFISNTNGYRFADVGSGSLTAHLTASSHCDQGVAYGDIVSGYSLSTSTNAFLTGTINTTNIANMPSSELTLSAWIKLPNTTTNGTWKQIVSKYFYNYPTYVWPYASFALYLDISDYRKLYFILGTTTALYVGWSNVATTTIPLDQWTHVAMTYNGSTVQLYINGIQCRESNFYTLSSFGTYTPTTTAAGTINYNVGSNGNMSVAGNHSLNGEFLTSLIDDIRIESKARTSYEILRQYEAGFITSYHFSNATPPASVISGSYSSLANVISLDFDEVYANRTGKSQVVGLSTAFPFEDEEKSRIARNFTTSKFTKITFNKKQNFIDSTKSINVAKQTYIETNNTLSVELFLPQHFNTTDLTGSLLSSGNCVHAEYFATIAGVNKGYDYPDYLRGITLWCDYDETSAASKFRGLSKDDLVKIIFGTGDFNTVRRGESRIGEDPNSYYGSTNFANYRQYKKISSVSTDQTETINVGHDGRTLAGVSLRGWKYGLLNGFKTRTKTIFRRNHYGQFRDMLEQRLYSRLHNEQGILASPIDVKFVNYLSRNAVDAASTTSTNTTYDASVTKPFFDIDEDDKILAKQSKSSTFFVPTRPLRLTKENS